jgi:Mce-associated membrane protein
VSAVGDVSAQKRLALGLAVLVVAAAVVLLWLTRTAQPAVSGVTTSESGDAVVASAAVKDEVLAVAEEAATRVYGYSWRTLTEDKAAARALLTGDMLRQYDRTMAGVATSSRQDRTVVRAEVSGAALVTATESEARVLVFVDQRTDAKALDEPTLDLDRVLVSLVRTRGAWKVSELDAL